MERKSHICIVLLIIVVGLAGCSGLSSFGGDQTGTDGQDTTDTPDISYPDGYNESGITDAETAAAQHTAALAEHDNFTEGMNLTSPKFDGFVNASIRIDNTDTRAAAVMEINQSNKEFLKTEMYHDENKSHTRSGMEGYGDTYTTSNESLSSFRETLVNASAVDGWLANISFEGAGTVTRNDETLYRYNATDVDDQEAFFYTTEFSTIDSIESVNSTLLVDREGSIRSFEITVTYLSDGESKEGTIRYRVTDIDSTSVTEPDWLGEAESSAESK